MSKSRVISRKSSKQHSLINAVTDEVMKGPLCVPGFFAVSIPCRWCQQLPLGLCMIFVWLFSSIRTSSILNQLQEEHCSENASFGIPDYFYANLQINFGDFGSYSCYTTSTVIDTFGSLRETRLIVICISMRTLCIHAQLHISQQNA